MTPKVLEPVDRNKADLGVPSGVSPSGTTQTTASPVRAFLGGDGRIAALERYGTLAARILISQIFIISGIMKILGPEATAAQMEGRGMFWVPLFLVGAILFELGGGLSLLLGYKTRLGALA